MPISSGEQPAPEPELGSAPDDQGTENSSAEQLREKVDAAKENFLKIAATEGPSSEIAIGAYTTYNDLLISMSEAVYRAYPTNTPNPELDRELWYGTEILKTFIEANKANPAYQEMVAPAQEDLDMVQ